MVEKIFREKIVGRKRELNLLEELMQSKKAEFIAVYGRRRIGKTFLVRNFMKSVSCVFFHVTGLQRGTKKEQIDEFAKQMGETFYQGASITSRTKWKDAFEDLTLAISKLPKEQKITLFFDEFPWMATPRSRLMTALELYWNRYWVFDERIKLVVCGSATSWIIENIINNKGGLHNRVTRTIHLKPFSLSEAASFLKANKVQLNHRKILDLYIVLGGVPLYWSFIRKGLSASQSIDELCFQSDGPLIKEFNRLFESLFEDAKPYKTLIKTIAKHRYGIGQADLITQSKLPDGGTTVRRLHQLEETGFITSLIPYGHKDKGVYYLIDDEYSLFYLHWIEPNLKTISKKAINTGFWVSQSIRPSWKGWAGLAFESICYKHLDQIRYTLKLDAGSIAGTWRYSPRPKTKQEGAQIDLLFDRPDGAITVCEIKYSEQEYAVDKSYAKMLLKRWKFSRNRLGLKNKYFSQ